MTILVVLDLESKERQHVTALEHALSSEPWNYW